jgi:hypothetical protein
MRIWLSRSHDTGPLSLTAWLELDRVRRVLSCIILACLLALIIVGGRNTGAIPAPHHMPRQGFFAEPFIVLPVRDR